MRSLSRVNHPTPSGLKRLAARKEENCNFRRAVRRELRTVLDDIILQLTTLLRYRILITEVGVVIYRYVMLREEVEA